MSDTRWIEVEDELSAACSHYGKAAALFDQGGFDEETLDGYRAKMALMHSMQSAHTSLEAGLKRILEILGEEAPGGEQSHRDLVRRVARPVTIPGRVRPAILPADVASDVGSGTGRPTTTTISNPPSRVPRSRRPGALPRPLRQQSPVFGKSSIRRRRATRKNAEIAMRLLAISPSRRCRSVRDGPGARG